MIGVREQEAQHLLAALHEAGHAIVASACGFPLAHAWVQDGRGEVAVDQPKAAMLSARHKRRNSNPPHRAGSICAQLAIMGWVLAGANAVELRAAARPAAPWQPHAGQYWRMSRADRRGWYGAVDRLRDFGINGGQAAPALADWVDETLTRHSSSVGRLAVALLRHRRLTGPELDRLLAPVKADREPFARLILLATRIAADAAMVWPAPPEHPGPSWDIPDAGGNGARPL